MRQLKWSQIVDAVNSAPDVIKGLRDYISMKGALDIKIPRGEPLPQRLYDTTSDIEAKLREAYPNIPIIGEESANEIDSEHPDSRYLGQIYGANAQGLGPFIKMEGTQTREFYSAVETLLTFFAAFPLGREYDGQSIQAIQNIWGHIKGFDFVFHNGNSQIPSGKQGKQSILLVRDGNPVASGKYALLEASIHAAEKEPIMLQNGIIL